MARWREDAGQALVQSRMGLAAERRPGFDEHGMEGDRDLGVTGLLTGMHDVEGGDTAVRPGYPDILGESTHGERYGTREKGKEAARREDLLIARDAKADVWGRIWRASDVRACVVNSEGACCDLLVICRRNGWSVPLSALIKVLR